MSGSDTKCPTGGGPGHDPEELTDFSDKIMPLDNVHRVHSPALGRNWPGPWRKTPGRILGTTLVRFYQLTLSGFVGNSCRHLPTCSEYAYEAIARHGLWAGGWMGLFRVLRCGPGGTHGIDNVPAIVAAPYLWYAPWRYWRIGRNAARG